MDHLPSVKNPHNPVRIPDLGGEDYDCDGFFDFPSRRGWSEERLSQSPLGSHTRLMAGQFLQTWLFYGLLSEILGVRIPRTHFSYEDAEGRRWITTERLSEYVHAWGNRTRSSRNTEKIEKKKYANECLHRVVQIFRGSKGYSVRSILGTEITLSIIILVGTLDWCVVRIYGVPAAAVEPSTIEHMRTEPTTLLKPRLDENGWCPSLIHRLTRMVGFSGLYYATLLGPMWVKKNHTLCSDKECKADFVDDETYLTKHARIDCQCEFIGPDVNRLNSIVESEHIPLISIDEDCSLEVMALSYGNTYVAISHVWADGLGNPRANSLPRCQLQFLRQRVMETYHHFIGQSEPKYFWIDTLCVPLHPSTARKAAIRKMCQVYQKATRVLVLDTEVMHSTANCEAEEIFMRIICSSWFHRLWTLQEAALAKGRLCIQFRERSIDINVLSDGTYRSFELHNEIAYRTHSILTQPWLIFSDTSLSPVKRFCVVWQALQGRSTSRSADEPICVGTLLGMNVDALIETPDEERMVEFWAHQERLPVSLLFVNGPKLNVDGYRWAPSTLLRRGKTARLLSWDRGVAWHTSHGFSLASQGILLSRCKNVHKGHIFRFSEHSSQIRYIMYIEREEDSSSRQDIDLENLKAPAVVLRDALTERSKTAGALVADSQGNGTTISARYVANVRVLLEGGAMDKMMGLAKSVLIESTGVATAEKTRRDQVWCIR